MQNDIYFNNYKIAPLGYLLRKKYPENWFRIHNLPNARRYPDNEDDINEIIKRYDLIFDEIMSDAVDVVGYLTIYEVDLEDMDNLWIEELSLKFLGQIDISEDGDEESYARVYKFSSSKSTFLKIILDVSDDCLYGKVIFFCENNLNIISPYDGGTDIIINNSSKYEILKNKFKQWLSKRDDGL
jgi:hypothetical protein